MIYGILLAAGVSSRMGRPKQLLEWHGQPLVCHGVQQALAADLNGLVVVVGAYADEVKAALSDWEVQNPNDPDRQARTARLSIVENPAYASGQASSLRAGLAALPADAEAALVLLVDQPLITPALINRLIDTYREPLDHRSSFPLAVIPRYHGQRGNPALLSWALFGELQALTGDEGARSVLQRHAAQIRWLEVDDPAVVMDVDTWAEYNRLKRETC